MNTNRPLCIKSYLTINKGGMHYAETYICSAVPYNIKILNHGTEVYNPAMEDYVLAHSFCSIAEFLQLQVHM